MIDNILLLPLIIVLVFWAYREFCHHLEVERLYTVLLQKPTTIRPPTTLPVLPPTSPPAPALQEADDTKRLQRERMAALEKERLENLTASSEAGLSRLLGSTHVVD